MRPGEWASVLFPTYRHGWIGETFPHKWTSYPFFSGLGHAAMERFSAFLGMKGLPTNKHSENRNPYDYWCYHQCIWKHFKDRETELSWSCWTYIVRFNIWHSIVLIDVFLYNHTIYHNTNKCLSTITTFTQYCNLNIENTTVYYLQATARDVIYIWYYQCLGSQIYWYSNIIK